MSTKVARLVRISGLVQGVFFRAWTQQQAQELGASGWVRNCDDGTVEAHVAGEADAVERMIDRLRSGPPHARVEAVDVCEVSPGHETQFTIRR